MNTNWYWLRVIYLISFTKVFCDNKKYSYFPEGFSIGAASAAYQIEGGWNASDKGVNVWDDFTHQHSDRIDDRVNGDVACDSYHRYKEDVEWAQKLGANHYRFSLSWSRILPNGFSNKVSKTGLDYYRSLIHEIISRGMQPYVTLYHWDHPKIFEDMGGWTNDLMVDWFGDYARVVFQEFGDDVKMFITLNEPPENCRISYKTGDNAPGKMLQDVGIYLCVHNMLKAHAKAYHIYDQEFRDRQKGQIGIAVSCEGKFPKDENEIGSEEVMFEFDCGWVGHPVFSKTGDYSDIMKDRIGENSRIAGYSRSRLPEFTTEEIDYIKGSSDYFGLNHYTSHLTENIERISNQTLWYMDSGIKQSQDPKWPSSASFWLKVVPKGIREVLRKIKKAYNNPPIYIMESGFSDSGGLEDNHRIHYLKEYISSMLMAVNHDKCNVKAYTVWSLLDTFEWSRGYRERFGLIHVDFKNPNRTRTSKHSFDWLKKVIKNRTIEPVSTETKCIEIV